MQKIQLHPKSRILSEVLPMVPYHNKRVSRAVRNIVEAIPPMDLTPEKHSLHVKRIKDAIETGVY